MCKYIMLGLLVLLIALMVGAALVVQEYGWKGFLVLLVVLAVLGYIARKVTPWLLIRMISRPLRMMGQALHGGRIVVHSVVPCDPPPPEEEYDADDDEHEAIEDDGESGEQEADDEPDEDQSVGPYDWYLIEFTVVPPGDGASEGRMVTREVWSPQWIGAVGPRPPLKRANPFRGWPPTEAYSPDVQNASAEIWTGYAYE